MRANLVSLVVLAALIVCIVGLRPFKRLDTPRNENVTSQPPIPKANVEPEPPTVAPAMRLVSLQLPSERIVGQVRPNVLFDVRLTVQIGVENYELQTPNRIRPDFHAPMTDCVFVRTATITLVQQAKVVATRPSSQAVLSIDLEANPYRIALVEFAKNKGEISIVSAEPETSIRVESSVESDDIGRSKDVLNGEPVADQDLTDLLRLPTLEPRRLDNGRMVQGVYRFRTPPPLPTDTPGCKTCGKSPPR